jgi:citrate synthase
MSTVLFAVTRTVGWISQWSEMIEDPQQKIGRPRQLYTGVTRRDYIPMDKRGQSERLSKSPGRLFLPE